MARFARRSLDGEMAVATKTPRRRVTSEDILISRDLLIAQLTAEGKTQEHIAGLIDRTQQFVSKRLKDWIPPVVIEAMRRLAARHSWERGGTGIPGDAMDRLREAMREHYEGRRWRERLRSKPRPVA